jgi:phosphoglycolate phosphatase
MAVSVIVFDFDGTLVESNHLKYEAYFDLFPKDERHQALLRQVLAAHFEASRYVILEKIVRELQTAPDKVSERVNRLADQYNTIAVEKVKTCPERPGAAQALQNLSCRYPLYLSSTTPEEALRSIVAFRQWTAYFQAIYGYPHQKPATLAEILKQKRIQPQQLLVVGDGESDRLSAQQVGCRFWDTKNTPLAALLSYIEEQAESNPLAF